MLPSFCPLAKLQQNLLTVNAGTLTAQGARLTIPKDSELQAQAELNLPGEAAEMIRPKSGCLEADGASIPGHRSMCPAEENSGEDANEAAEGPGWHFWASLLPTWGAAPQENVAWTDPDSLCQPVPREPATGKG
jgi:hypothetical protein